MTIVANNYNEVIEYLKDNIDEAVKEAILDNNTIIYVHYEKPIKYHEKYDEYETEYVDTIEIDIETDLGITIKDILEYCNLNCKGVIDE